MIFVTLGTQDKQFKRLLEAVDNLKTDEEIIVQSGSTDYKFKKDNVKKRKYMSQKAMDENIKNARVIITHAGVGTIIHGLELNKKMIVAARLKKYNEHVNDHQLDILNEFAKDGYILKLDDFSKLEELINKDFTPKKFESNTEKFNDSLEKEIDRICK